MEDGKPEGNPRDPSRTEDEKTQRITIVDVKNVGRQKRDTPICAGR